MRNETSGDIFDYKDFSRWGRLFLRNSPDILTAEIVEHLRTGGDELGRGEEIVAWFDKVVSDEIGIGNATNILTDRLKGKFSLIRLYHGTRNNFLAPILSEGLIPARSGRMEARANETFGNGQFPGITNDRLKEIFVKLKPRLEQQAERVYFCVDDRHFDNCGHYLLYGSEYLQCVAAELQNNDGYGNPEYRERLREEGLPAVLVVDYPIKNLPERYSDLWGRLIIDILWMLAEDRADWWILDYTITLNGVPPEFIVSHYHPAEVTDPFHGFIVRTTKVIKCDSC